MKKHSTKLLFGLLTLVLFPLIPLHAYSFADFTNEVSGDTKQVFGQNLSETYFLDFTEGNDKRNKTGLGTPLLAWRMIEVDAVYMYTPSGSQSAFGTAFPIRLAKIPVGNGKTVGDFLQATYGNNAGWVQHLYVGPYFTYSVNDNRFGAGINAGIQFF